MPFTNMHKHRGQLSVILTGRDHHGKVSGKSFLEESLQGGATLYLYNTEDREGRVGKEDD